MASSLDRKKRGRPPQQTFSAKKRKVAVYERARHKTRVRIGKQVDKWNALKLNLGLNKHQDVARILLDSYYEHNPEEPEIIKGKEYGMFTPAPVFTVSSTPAHGTAPALSTSTMSEEMLSEITSNDSPAVQSSLSGCEELSSAPSVTDIPSQSKRRRASLQPRFQSSSFIDPFDLTIGLSEEEELQERSDEDEDYEPSFNIFIGPTNGDQLDDVVFENVLFDTEDNEETQDVEDEEDAFPEIKKIKEENVLSLTADETCLVYLDCLMTLAKQVRIDHNCQVKECSLRVEITHKFVGSALYLTWACGNGHIKHKWCSQPMLNRRMHSGDLLSSAAILMSGNNYSKVALFAKFLKLHFVSSCVHSRIQRVYLVPVIDSEWEKEQQNTLKEFEDKDLVVLGDGRMDSPGHSAQYCSYTVMENDSKKILSIITMDKRQTDRKSANMEKACFVKSLKDLLEKKARVKEVVTDAHMQIASVMKKDYKEIKHSHDIWHAAKNLGKKIMKAAGDKECRILTQWCPDIVNHFWYACKHASTYEEFLDIWYGMLHHIVNEHEWVLPYVSNGRLQCWHESLEAERPKPYLTKGSPAHQVLTKLVMDKRLMDKVTYYLNFRGTAELENFQQHILMYAGKRFAYTPPAYRVRNYLAALDHNKNFNRPYHVNKDGSLRYQRLYNKKTKRWTVVALKGPKSYDHVFRMLEQVVLAQIQDPVGMNKKIVMEESDPRNIAANVAPIAPPPTIGIVQEKISRT